ncbi:DUF2147 domain-containing protein [Pseudaquidulcibacter saccharophilus]|uniref:DUF2147 domain-containing protein n=1 Tax=Pseudaquidulcibacter saccharophilus TaxID=2831900 RepID=UPI001EFF16D1|nr:DUF2147 domain-containing protein [Pseudaquidulcibacter saccharophilus]
MTKKIFNLILFVFITFPVSAFSMQHTPYGNWARGDNIAKVNIYQCGANLCVKNIWIRPGTKSEKVGDYLVIQIHSHKNGQITGIAGDPQRNLKYKISMQYASEKMVSKGCILGGLVCKTAHWKKID